MASKKEQNNGGGYDAESAARAAKIAQIKALISALESKKEKYEEVKKNAAKIIAHIEEFITNLNRTGIAFSDIVLNGQAFDQGDFQNETKIFNEYKSNFDNIVAVCNKIIETINGQIEQLKAELAELGAE